MSLEAEKLTDKPVTNADSFVARATEPVPIKAPPTNPGFLKARINHFWQNPVYRRFFLLAVGAFLLLAVGKWAYGEFTSESTDDAFVTAHVHVVSARINGTVVDVPVKDNQFVKKGDLLIKLDPRDYEVRLKMAQASLEKAKYNLERWDGQMYLHPNEVLQKNLDQADLLSATAALEQANLNLQYTDIRAAEDGRVGNRAVETGQQVLMGQALMALVEPVPWVVANYKENQASRLKKGQPAIIRVDAISDREFTGQVDSVAPGSGATFSLLPPDNATGNFTKIVQRIPVKIVFDPDSIRGYEERLTTGMSVQVVVKH